MTIAVLGISGSLRKASYNSMALRAAIELAPEGLAISPFGIGDIPLYDEDVKQQGFPAPVEAFRTAIRQADALLIAAPEYNYSIPGVLKNAIDWASRPPEQPFGGKPIAIMSASPGLFGGARGQHHLRQVFVALDGRLINRPEVMIGSCAGKFDESGRLVDQPTRDHVARLLVALKAAVEARR